jgi:hypothetical protein
LIPTFAGMTRRKKADRSPSFLFRRDAQRPWTVRADRYGAVLDPLRAMLASR